MRDHFVIAQHRDTLKWHGLFYVNHPTPSGFPRAILKLETNNGFDSPHDALTEIKNAFTNEQLENIDAPDLSAIPFCSEKY